MDHAVPSLEDAPRSVHLGEAKREHRPTVEVMDLRGASMGRPNGLELSRSAEAGGAPHTLAPAGD